ncbi:MAG TPA: hypothetical protein VN698_12265 [Bacteroidia bacterium]|nr:hypothetical protein [Bacteroidia bacterium]
MQHTAPTLSKEQYERLVKLADKKEPNFYIERKQNIYGDLLSLFLKENTDMKSINSGVNFYNLLENVA